MGFLTDVVGEVRRAIASAPLDEADLRRRSAAAPPPGDLEAALRADGVGVIAEVKRASPSAGQIAQADVGTVARAYQSGGAAAISVLTEGGHFGGSLDDLGAARSSVSIPLLRKDFLVHPSQVLEARAAGADAVLLIPAALSDDELRALLSAASDVGMAALVEGHTAADLDRALAAGARVVGVNARDLETLDVDAARARELLRELPADRVRVLESGIAGPDDVRMAADAGADAVLVGEALMRAPDPAAAVRSLVAASRAPAGA